jgi:hypothetical protein
VTPEEVVHLVLREPPGAGVFKADLHIHTVHSKENGCTMTVQEAIDAAVSQKLDLVSITDHNCCEAYTEAVAYVVEKGFTIGLVPGVEVSTGFNGVHLLAYFRPLESPEKTANCVRTALVNLGIELNAQQNEPHGAKTELKPSEAVKALRSSGALLVLAHAEKACTLKGSEKVDLFSSTSVSGFELVGNPPEELKEHITKKCVLKGSDAHQPGEVGKQHTFIRGERPDFDTLYAALTDPISRVLSATPSTVFPYIMGLHIEAPAGASPDGMLDGFTARLNSGLNCLIGERGTFKSSIINVLRAVLGSSATASSSTTWDDRESKVSKEILQRVVGEGRTIHIAIAMATDDYLVASGTLVRGSVQPALRTTLGVSQTRLPSEACSTSLYMHDGIKARADDISWLAGTVDKTVPGVEALVARESELLGKLQENRKKLEALGPLKAVIASKRKELEGLRQRRAGLGVSAELAAVVDQKEEVIGWFKGVRRQIEAAASQLETISLGVTIPSAPSLPDKLSSLTSLLDEVKVAATAASTAIDGIREVGKNLEALAKQVTDAHDKMSAAFDELAKNQLGQLAPGASVEMAVESYKKLGDGIVTLSEEIDEKAMGLSSEADLLKTREGLLDELDKVRAERLALRERRCAEAWRSGAITIGWRPAGNTRAYMDFIKVKTSVKGLQDEEHRQPLVQGIAPRRLAALVRAKDQAGLVSDSGLPSHIAAKFLTECPKLADSTYELEEITYDDAPEIRFDDQGVKKPLTELSAGQRATVLLKLILAGGSGPLVIDQPEDDIDNKVIYDEIVTDIRREKVKRQLIMATHQANIPVLGDAEKILVLKSDGQHGSLRTQGCIENREVTGYVLRILEGGREAIMRRYQKYADEGLLPQSPTP